MNKEERLRNPETCWHVFLRKQTGPLDDGPAKSTRYRCQECGAFLVMKPYQVEVTIGSPVPRDKFRWEIARGETGEDDDWGIRREGEKRGQSIAQMVWKWDAEEIVAAHNAALANSGEFMAGWDARGGQL